VGQVIPLGQLPVSRQRSVRHSLLSRNFHGHTGHTEPSSCIYIVRTKLSSCVGATGFRRGVEDIFSLRRDKENNKQNKLRWKH
jgi:hypothetical protein